MGDSKGIRDKVFAMEWEVCGLADTGPWPQTLSLLLINHETLGSYSASLGSSSLVLTLQGPEEPVQLGAIHDVARL